MTNIVAGGQILYDLRKKIQGIKTELEQLLVEPTADIPEMIESTNLLRSNEYLSKTNDKKTELLETYEQYSESLEELLESVFDIQKDLKEILKDQSSLIPNSPKKQTKSKHKKK